MTFDEIEYHFLREAIMMHYLQQEELARLKHEELLAKAAWERRFAHLPRERTFHLPAVLHWLVEQGRHWVAPQRPVAMDGVTAASRQQPC